MISTGPSSIDARLVEPFAASRMLGSMQAIGWVRLLSSFAALLLACSKENSVGNVVRVEAETAGVNCVTGGVAIYTGLDADGDGELDLGEVTATSYVCNGANGSDGAAGAMGSEGAMGSQGDPGQQGLPGDQGLGGDPGADGFGLAWFDANGQRLERARGPDGLFFDEAGFVWILNPSNGQLSPFASGGGALFRIYESVDCSGTEFLGPLQPNMPAGVTFRRQPDDGQVYARKFDAGALTVGACSNRGFNGGACGGFSGCPEATLVIRSSDTLVVTPPVLPLNPPFHLGLTP